MKKKKILAVEIGKREIYVSRKFRFVFRVCMVLVGSRWSESDPMVIYQFRNFDPPDTCHGP